MADIHKYTDDTGAWLSMLEKDRPIVAAHFPSASDMATLYWPGEANSTVLLQRFESLCNAYNFRFDASPRLAKAIYFTTTIREEFLRVTVSGLYTHDSEIAKRFSDVRFARFEYFAWRGNPEKKQKDEPPAIIAWAHQNVSAQANTQSLVGIFLDSWLLEREASQIAELVVNTASYGLSREIYYKLIQDLSLKNPRREAPQASA